MKSVELELSSFHSSDKSIVINLGVLFVKDHFKKSLKDFSLASSLVFLNLSFDIIKLENNNNGRINFRIKPVVS
ncbi:hypothetical protein D3C86_2145620 [compost metagenome]